jgi:hypothetical protein
MQYRSSFLEFFILVKVIGNGAGTKMNNRNAVHLFTWNNSGLIGKNIGCPDTSAEV